MSVQSDPQLNALISPEDVGQIWRVVCERRQFKGGQDTVVVKCVDENESKQLNTEYRNKSTATNVLTFSDEWTHPENGRVQREHDIVLCLAVATAEATERSLPLRDYVVLLLTHAFLHAVGLDHERSAAEAEETSLAEQEILASLGYQSQAL